MLGDPLQDLLEAELLQPERVLGPRLHLVPGDRRGDVGRSRPRREYGEMVVLEPAFCDQSRNTFPDLRALVMVAVTSFGCSFCSSSATSLASPVVSSGLSLPGSAA